MTIKEKIAQYAHYQDIANNYATQIAQLDLLKAEAESEANVIKKQLADEMISSGQKRAMIDGWKLSVSTSTSAVVEEADLIPKHFMKVQTTPNLMQIKEYIKTGGSIEGVVLKINQNFSLKKA